MNTTIGTSQASLVLTSNATNSLQRYYFTRFVSETLTGVSSITAQTWTYNFAALESAALGNFPFTTSGPVRVMCYVWRPGTGKVGDIADGNSSTLSGEVAGLIKSRIPTFAGSLVSGVQDGDVLCFEVWFEITQAGTVNSYTDTFYYDGTTVTTADNTTVSNHASFIETPQTLTFGTPSTPVDCTVTGKSIYNKTTTHA